MTQRRCDICKKVKDTLDFHKKKSDVLGIQSTCKDCKSVLSKQYYETTFVYSVKKNMVSGAQKRAKLKNIEFNITLSDIEDLIKKQNNMCALSGVELDWDVCDEISSSRSYPYSRASLDRIDSSKGYTLDNVQLVTNNINKAKSTMTTNEFIFMCRQVVDYANEKCAP